MTHLKMQLVEHWGTGLKRIREICAENDIEEPSYTATSAFFTATVKRKSFEQKMSQENYDKGTNVPLNVPLSERLHNIINCISENPIITAKEIAEKLGVNEKTIKRDISELKEKNILIREGSKKTGSWKINMEEQ